jgi:hypothetical protein
MEKNVDGPTQTSRPRSLLPFVREEAWGVASIGDGRVANVAPEASRDGWPT